MLKPLLACLTLAALPAAALAQTPTPGQWTVSASGSGCIAYSSFPQGTVVSVLAGKGQDELIFMIQNKDWASLEDGAKIPLALQFDGQSRWQFDAVAKTELDSDGPGLLFTVSPASDEKFLAAFAGAAGMDVGQNGRSVAQLRLGGGGSAMSQLARCMARMWNGGSPDAEADAALPVSSIAATPL